MNEENVRYAIEIMKGAENLYMCEFQSCGKLTENLQRAYSIEELHACGNRACFVGYLCLSRGWKSYFSKKYPYSVCSTSGSVNTITDDIYVAAESLSMFLGISEELSESLIYGYTYYTEDGDYFKIYPVEFELVKPEHVINTLERILTGQLV